MPADPLTKVLPTDGHGIHRIPLTIVAPGGKTEGVVVAVLAEQLDALEQLLDDARNIVATCTADGLHWDDEQERAKFFTDASRVWERLLGVLRGDDEAFDAD